MKLGQNNGFGVWTQCIYLKVSTGHSFLYIDQVKCNLPDAAKCGIQRSHRLKPVLYGLVKWHQASIGPPRKGPASYCLSLTLWEREGLWKCLAVLNCSEIKSSSDKFKGMKLKGTLATIILAIVCGRLNPPHPSQTTPPAGTHRTQLAHCTQGPWPKIFSSYYAQSIKFGLV